MVGGRTHGLRKISDGAEDVAPNLNELLKGLGEKTHRTVSTNNEIGYTKGSSNIPCPWHSVAHKSLTFC